MGDDIEKANMPLKTRALGKLRHDMSLVAKALALSQRGEVIMVALPTAFKDKGFI